MWRAVRRSLLMASAGGASLILIVMCIVLIIRKMVRGNSAIDEIRRAQEAMRQAQARIHEEAVKLDGKLLELMESQLSESRTTAGGDGQQIDHSLVKKVADEIVRIEMNLSRMDPAIKGYKQLSKAVQRIKDNFNANGYEIVDMLGKQYKEGMKVTANFVADESLEPGQQIITGIVKPQINYNGKMIQAAQITVSQNI